MTRKLSAKIKTAHESAEFWKKKYELVYEEKRLEGISGSFRRVTENLDHAKENLTALILETGFEEYEKAFKQVAEARALVAEARAFVARCL